MESCDDNRIWSSSIPPLIPPFHRDSLFFHQLESIISTLISNAIHNFSIFGFLSEFRSSNTDILMTDALKRNSSTMFPLCIQSRIEIIDKILAEKKNVKNDYIFLKKPARFLKPTVVRLKNSKCPITRGKCGDD